MKFSFTNVDNKTMHKTWGFYGLQNQKNTDFSSNNPQGEKLII